MIKINCPVCGKEIVNPRIGQVTCGGKCRKQYFKTPEAKERRKEYYQKNKERKKKYFAKYNQKNKEKIRKYHKAYYKANEIHIKKYREGHYKALRLLVKKHKKEFRGILKNGTTRTNEVI